MSRRTLFDPPNEFEKRLKILEKELNRKNAELLLHVELGFSLMEYLGLDDEPVSAVWAILSGMPLRIAGEDRWDADKRRAIANARQIVPYSSRFAWIDALRDYLSLPRDRRHYDFDGQDMDSQIINACKDEKPRHTHHEHLYQQCLRANLSFHERRPVASVKAGMYRFDSKTETGDRIIPVEFSQEHLDSAMPLPAWFTGSRPRSPFLLHFSDMLAAAHKLDAREDDLARMYGWNEARKGHWVRRFNKLDFHQVLADDTLARSKEQILELSGFVHLAGMVASGKSTLALLLATHIQNASPDRRITLVVGDVQTAIRLANQINWWFRDDPENDAPVAVPLLGRRSRDKHLRDFHDSRDYLEHRRCRQSHWGERWLQTACPLQGLIQDRDFVGPLHGHSITPGYEPCQSLKEIPIPGKQQKGMGASHLCPFFGNCPSHQIVRDTYVARIWITTPGAMALGSLPRHLESRSIHQGELVYEQSDIVVFDEADTVLQWFDNVYAEEVWLTNSNDGVFDKLGIHTERFSVPNRQPAQGTQRWMGAQRDTQTAISATLTLLNQGMGHQLLRIWVARGYFTPNTLFYKLARRIAGLAEFDALDLPEEQRHANDQQTQSILQSFDMLFDHETDPLRPRHLKAGSPSHALASILQEINTTGESAFDDMIQKHCQEWIVTHFPEAAIWRQAHEQNQKLESKATRKRPYGKPGEEKDDSVDTLDTLALRLQFALTVALLDRHTRIVFYEWHNRPASIEDDQQPHRRMPAALLDILPLPPTGRQFGTYYCRGSEESDSNENSSGNSLALFAYTNIGRSYVLNFHRLLTDLDGRLGPNVLALSGTSYLPDSTRFHVSKPQGILLPDADARSAIAGSYFAFLPQYEPDGETPIRISGRKEREKPERFQAMARALVGHRGNGPLGQELNRLGASGQSDPTYWKDRERLLLLVNSYEQARWVAQQIRQAWPQEQERVYYVRRSTKPDSYGEVFLGGGREDNETGMLNRPDIETFSQTVGRILVAPMSAIGRGYNILNADGKAAFGTVYFLTRPYPHPHDTKAIAQEINRRALDWASDPEFIAWDKDGVLQRAEEIRRLAARYWRSAEQRSYYHTLRSDLELRADPRRDLTATTAGLIIQAVGRLLRGGVPFHAYFVDAAWGPNNADRSNEKADTPRTSLLAAIIDLLEDYADKDRHPIGHALYAPLTDALVCIEGFRRESDPKKEIKK